jgi:hypothetical protein
LNMRTAVAGFFLSRVCFFAVSVEEVCRVA